MNYKIEQYLVGRALEEGRVLFGDGIENTQQGWEAFGQFRKGLVEMPVPGWVELGFCNNPPWDGESGSSKYAYKDEVLDLIKAWVEKIEKGGV